MQRAIGELCEGNSEVTVGLKSDLLYRLSMRLPFAKAPDAASQTELLFKTVDDQSGLSHVVWAEKTGGEVLPESWRQPMIVVVSEEVRSWSDTQAENPRPSELYTGKGRITMLLTHARGNSRAKRTELAGGQGSLRNLRGSHNLLTHDTFASDKSVGDQHYDIFRQVVPEGSELDKITDFVHVPPEQSRRWVEQSNASGTAAGTDATAAVNPPASAAPQDVETDTETAKSARLRAALFGSSSVG